MSLQQIYTAHVWTSGVKGHHVATSAIFCCNCYGTSSLLFVLSKPPFLKHLVFPINIIKLDKVTLAVMGNFLPAPAIVTVFQSSV